MGTFAALERTRWLLAMAIVATLVAARGDARADNARAENARQDGAFRAVLVIDASSSMRKTDPGGLRKVAAELFVDMARDGDRIAVTGFDENARQSTDGFITVEGPGSRTRIKEAIRAVGNDGKWTDFTAGLGEARRLLDRDQSEPGDQSLVVFLTDGRCEPDPAGALAGTEGGRAGREQACKDQVLQLAGELDGARVYAIGLSKGAPVDFLEELGRRTGGRGATTLTPRELPRLFAEVYAELLGSRLHTGATENGEASFEVFDGAQALDLVVVGRTDKSGTLTSPGGREVPIDNRNPRAVYFVGAKEYRFYKIADPPPGTWTVRTEGKGEQAIATLQHFDLAIEAVDPPDVSERGKPVVLRARLASPSGAMPPSSLLERHRMTAIVSRDGSSERVALELGPDGVFTAPFTAERLGPLEVSFVLEPAAGGMLSRTTGPLFTLRVIPPVHLRAGSIELGIFKQGQVAEATLDLASSEVGIGLPLALTSDAADLTIEPDTVLLGEGADAARQFPIRVRIAEDAEVGQRRFTVTARPTVEAFADRAATAEVVLTVEALTFWERHGRLVMGGAGALVVLLLLVGIFAPAKFPRRAILHYIDARDPDLERQSSYPLGVKARRSLFRGARLAIGPTGPVKRGGIVELRAAGGGVVAHVLRSGSKVLRVPAETDDFGGAAERPEVPLSDGSFRLSAGARYEVEGAGLIFWYK